MDSAAAARIDHVSVELRSSEPEQSASAAVVTLLAVARPWEIVLPFADAPVLPDQLQAHLLAGEHELRVGAGLVPAIGDPVRLPRGADHQEARLQAGAPRRLALIERELEVLYKHGTFGEAERPSLGEARGALGR